LNARRRASRWRPVYGASTKRRDRRAEHGRSERASFIFPKEALPGPFTALKALYIGKPWGTWLDYVEAILWALTTATALTLILVPALDQLAKLRPLDKLIRSS